MKTVFLRTQYNYDTNKAGDESGLKCDDKSLTKQSMSADTDINTIVKRFNLTGELPTNVRMPSYGDFTGIHDFQSAMNAIAQANEAFDAMPAATRARFHNDPAEFVDFVADDKNIDEARKLGLVPAKELQEAASLTHGDTKLPPPPEAATPQPRTPKEPPAAPPERSSRRTRVDED